MAHVFYEGHANFRIKDTITIWIDPFYEGNPLTVHDWKTLEKPDVILVTHAHDDHIGQTVEIAKKTGAKVGCIYELAHYFTEKGVPSSQILNHGVGWNMGGTVEYNGVKFTMYQAIHTSNVGLPISFVITFPSGFTCYHAGDTALFSDMKLIAEAHKINLAMLPIGDVFTMDAVQARKAADFLKAEAVIPMHYKTFPILVQSSDEFVKEMTTHLPNIKVYPLDSGETVTL